MGRLPCGLNRVMSKDYSIVSYYKWNECYGVLLEFILQASANFAYHLNMITQKKVDYKIVC